MDHLEMEKLARESISNYIEPDEFLGVGGTYCWGVDELMNVAFWTTGGVDG